MPLREVNAKIRYKENCNYEASETQCNILVPTQDVTIGYNIINTNYPERDVMNFAPTNSNEHFYNDVLNLFISITDENGMSVKSGSVDVYYFKYNDTSDSLTSETLLNKEPLLVDENGSVAIAYQPHEFGSFYIKYNGNQNYNDASLETERILINDIPTLTNFTKAHPYFAEVNDAVDMEVKVTDIYNNTVNYGLVTFISYLKNTWEDGIEHIIGNPAMVINGNAKTTYSPIRAFNDHTKVYYNPATGNVGYLYDDKEDMTVVTMTNENYSEFNNFIFPDDFEMENLPCLMWYKDGSRQLNFLYDMDMDIIKTNVELIRAVYNYDNMRYGTRWKYYLQSSDLTSIAMLRPNALNLNVISVNNGDAIPMTVSNDEFLHMEYGTQLVLEAKLLDIKGNHIALEADEIDFIIKGTKVVVKSDTLTDNHDYNVEANYSYIPYKKTFKGTYRDTFGNDNDVFVGELNELLSPGNYTVYAHLDVTKDQYEEDITHTGSEYGNIKDEIYYREVDSEKIYIQVEQDRTNYEIELKEVETEVSVQTALNPIKAEISINNEYRNALIGKTCYFCIGDNEYQAPISDINDKLIAELDVPISFAQAGDYPIYAYMKEGDYIYNGTSVHLYRKASNVEIIKARYILVPEVNVQVLQDTFYGKVRITETINNIYTTETPMLNIAVFKNGSLFEERQYEMSINDNTAILELDELEADYYEVKSKVGFEKIVGENNVIVYGEEITDTFDINKATLSDYNDTLYSVPTHPEQTITIRLNTTGNTFNTLNASKLKVILDGQDTKECSFSIAGNTITAICPLYKAGEYTIRATYEGSDNFNALDDEPHIRFNATNVIGSLLMEREDNGDLKLQIRYNSLHNGQYIYGMLRLYNFDNDKIAMPVIFNSAGELTISNPSMDEYEWLQYYRATLELQPTSETLIEQLLNGEINIYANDDSYIALLNMQIESMNNEVIFTTYAEQIINGEVNGTGGS